MGDQLYQIRHLREDAIIDRLRRDALRAQVVAWLRGLLRRKRGGRGRTPP